MTDALGREGVEQALRASEERYRTLFDSIDQGFCTVEVIFDERRRPVDYVFLEVNRAFEKLTGITGALGKRMRELRPDHEEHWFATYGRIATTGRPERFVSEAAALGRWYNVYAFRLDEPARHRVGILFEDITERKRAETALRESEQRFRAFVSASSEVVYRMSPDWSQMRELDGQRFLAGTSEPTEHWMEEYILPEDRVSVREAIDRAIRTKSLFELEHRVRRADGTIGWTFSRAAPVLDEGGQIIEWLGAASDVTSRHRTESLFRSLFESIDEGVMVIERAPPRSDGLRDWRMRMLATGIPQLVFRSLGDGHRIWGSPQWIEYTDLSFEDSLGFGWLDRVHPDDRRATMDAWEGVEERGEYYVEHRICDAASRAYRWHQTRAAPLRDEQGRILEWVGTSTDVEELRQLHRHQQTLLAELQHRVRNTLGVVRSIARRTAERSGTVEEMSSHFQGRLDAFSRVQAAVTRNPEAGVDLKSLIEDELLAHAAREGESLTIEGPEVSLKARAAESISLAVHELTTNAVKYGALSDGDGRIAVRWERVRPDGREVLRLVWEENGVELPLETPQRQGFGLDLLQRTLPYDLRAETRVEFRPEGLRFEMAMPLGPDVLAASDASG